MFRKPFILLSCCISLLTACNMQAAKTAAPQPESSPIVTAAPVLTATPVGPRVLTVCMGEEPNSLYPYSSLNMAARGVLGAIYDGPIDQFSNGAQPVILKQLPSLKNGDAQINPVEVKRGDSVIDSSGNVVALDIGTSVLPSGCSDDSCAVKYDGTTALKMDQMAVTFRLLPDLTWSDGQPLTSADSIFSFNIASDAATPNSKYLVLRTKSYEALDDLSVQWWGVPGFIDPDYANNFFIPLPKHAWGSVPAADLARGDTSARTPLGWGPYIFKEWSPGQYIRLDKNPAYFRAAKGFPRFDTLVFRFMKDAPTAISALIAGQCDLLDTSLRLDGQIDLLTELQRNNQVKLLTSTTPLIERLDFGIRPASYDNGYAPAAGDRPDIFGDVRTRQGIAYCLDRQKVVNTVLAGMSQVPDTFVAPSHPLFNNQVAKYSFDINKGIVLLQQAGWADTDKNPATPLVAVTVANVPAGTPLVVTYKTTSALQRRQVSEILSQSLSQCGVGVNVQYLSQDDLYAPGPDGPLFGRNFDLAEYAVGIAGSEPPCSWFESDQIPAVANKWLGLNISGYSNPDYDTVCRTAERTLPDQDGHKTAYDQAQVIFANDLPSIPLYIRIKAAATRVDLCNFNLDSFAVNDLWNIEELDYGAGCGGG